ncbi:MAG: FtsW/RodA/SpoVE family cell cycle protein [Candidatus Nanopelagicales bacterium]
MKTQTNSAHQRAIRDYYTLVTTLLVLLAFGAIMVVSASSIQAVKDYGFAWGYAVRHFAAIGVGLICMYALLTRSLKQIRRLSSLFIVVTFVLLVAVLIIGDTVAGQKNWISLPFGFSLQPSEFAKFALVLWAASAIAANSHKQQEENKAIISATIVGVVIIGLVVAERDMGTPIILGSILLAIYFAHGVAIRHILSFAFLSGLFVVLYSFMGSDYRVNRFQAWLAPEDHPISLGWQFLRGQLALAQGGLMGKGLGQSHEKWGNLPAPHTDFILAVIGEELGLIGTMIVLGGLLVLVLTILTIAIRSKDMFSQMVAYGIAMWFGIQTFVNVGAIVQFLPITGVPLPFISYGGSAMIVNLMAMGVVVAIAKQNISETE